MSAVTLKWVPALLAGDVAFTAKVDGAVEAAEYGESFNQTTNLLQQWR